MNVWGVIPYQNNHGYFELFAHVTHSVWHEIVATASYSGDIVNVSVAAIAGDKLTVDVQLGTSRRTKITLSPTYVHTVSVRKQFAQVLTNYSRISASCHGSNDSLHGCVAFVAGAADCRSRSCSAQLRRRRKLVTGRGGRRRSASVVWGLHCAEQWGAL